MVGLLVVRLVERPRSLSSGAPEIKPKLRLLPVPPPQPQKSWIGVLLIDQAGTPVPGRGYRIVDFEGTVYEGTLDAAATAKVTDLDDGPCRVSCPYLATRASLTHTVKPGEHISGIAQTWGFDDYTTVWNDPGNAGLRSVRANPHVLAGGDQVRIPALKDLPVTKFAGDQYTFAIKISPLKLRLQMLDLLGNPISGSPVTINNKSLTTDGSGGVEAPVDKAAKNVSVELSDNEQLDMALGALGPNDVDSDVGWKARLYNLGYLLDPTVDDDDEEMILALQDFQEHAGLPVTGQLDDATKAQIKQIHGC
jgi:hypothetical protein